MIYYVFWSVPHGFSQEHLEPVYTVPDSLGHVIEFELFAVIFTLTTIFYDYLLLNSAILS